MLLALIFGIPLGLLSALYADHLFGKAIRSFYITGIAIPVFWLTQSCCTFQLFKIQNFSNWTV